MPSIQNLKQLENILMLSALNMCTKSADNRTDDGQQNNCAIKHCYC